MQAHLRIPAGRCQLLKFKDKLDLSLVSTYAHCGHIDHAGLCVAVNIYLIYLIKQVLKFISCSFNYKCKTRSGIGGRGEQSQLLGRNYLYPRWLLGEERNAEM